MLNLALFCYLASFIFQMTAAFIALISLKRTGRYYIGWLFFSIALILMLGRRVHPMLLIFQTHEYEIVDAILSLPISFFLLAGVFAIRNVIFELNQKNDVLQKVHQIDYLTGAFTRAETFLRGNLEIERSFRSKQPLAFLMLDIDHFKRINDIHGHQTGDFVLKNLTRICQSSLRKIDIFGRYGGEEFLVILPETDAKASFKLADRIRAMVENQLSVDSQLSDTGAITISIGIYVFEPDKHSFVEKNMIINTCIEFADQAMYQAKNSGRNKVCLCDNNIN